MKRAVIAAMVLVSFGAMAQTEKPTQQKPPPQKVDFTVQELIGTIEKPVGDIFFAPPKHHFDSMIRVRANFNPELQKSVDSL